MKPRKRGITKTLPDQTRVVRFFEYAGTMNCTGGMLQHGIWTAACGQTLGSSEPLLYVHGGLLFVRESDMISPAWITSLKMRESLQVSAAALLLMLGLVMVISDPHFTFIDDEVQIISAAAHPMAQTVDLFVHGTGQFQHPPLYDLLLHIWLRLTGNQVRWLRLPSIVFYLLGIWVLMQAARGFCGNHAANTVLWVSVLWPFGFHFGRLAAWYSLSFLLVAILTFRYFAFLAARTLRNWLGMVIPAILLLYTNYFGWAILACLLFDFLLQSRHELRQRWSQVLFTVLLLVMAFSPLVRAFFAIIEARGGTQSSVLGTALFGGFNFYALFASESVAPWHWALGVPVCMAITVCAVSVLLYAPPAARRLFIYSLLLIVGMLLLGILGTKRLLLIAAWVVLPVGLCLGTTQTRRGKVCLSASLIVIAAVGWFGTVARRYYAAPRFIEPWDEVAKQMAGVVRDGGVIIASHPSFFFYLTYELDRQEKGGRLDFSGVWPYEGGIPHVYDDMSWLQSGRPVAANVLVVKDVSFGETADEVEHGLEGRCALENVDQMLPDSGFRLKERFFPGVQRVRYRIEVWHYTCREVAGE